MAPDLIGKTLGRYQITSLLDESGIGFIYEGIDSRTQREVAIRVMPELFSRQTGFEARFLLAARTASRLDHPGIVKVYDFGKYENYLYLVMEFITGETLAQKLEEARLKREYLPQMEAVQLAAQIVRTLDYASQQGVMHIDLHPSKIILKPNGSEGLPYRPVITGQGLAWLVSGENLPQQIESFGSPAYFSPEQARGAPLDIRSDVFTCGVLLYQLTTMKLPYRVKTVAEAVEYHRKKPPRSPRSRRPSLPEYLEQVIMKALQVEPFKRYQDLASLAQELEKTANWIDRNPPSRPIDAAVRRREPAPRRPAGQPPGRPQVDSLLVEEQNRPAYTIPITKREMSIGRGKSADIPLNSLGVSRTHARLVFDEREYYLIDLDSTNGTFLDEGRLLPGVRDQWSPGKVARIGPFSLRLLRVGELAPESLDKRPITQILMRDGKAAEQKHIRRSSGEGRIGVVLEEDDLQVAAGESVDMTIVLSNQGVTVDHFQVSIEGVPPSWVTVKPQTVNLMPNDQGSVLATYKPPKASTSKAGIYDLTIRVASTEAPDQKVEVIAALTVLPFVEYSSELHPQKIDVNQKARITIRNKGNNAETFVLILKDKADKLKFTPPQAQALIPEGQPGALEFSAKTRKFQLMRKSVTHPYTAELGAASGGEKRTYDGEVVSNGLIPGWLLPLFLIVCLGLAAAVPIIYSVLAKPKPTPTPVPVALESPTASPTLPFDVVSNPTATEAPGQTPTVAASPTPPDAPFSCPGVKESQDLKNGDIVRVTNAIDTLNVYGNHDTKKDDIIGKLETGMKLVIISKPFCAKTDSKPVVMYKVKFFNDSYLFPNGDNKGWVVEGLDKYYISPAK
jgi:serine/threonine protein kinase